jgi:threonine dehydrogenase-like Zn-dependent dehydrogenase
VKPGGTAWYVGAGPLGLMHIEKGLADGAKHIIVSDLKSERLTKVERTFAERARQVGATLLLFNPAEKRPETLIPPHSVDDVIVLCASRQAGQEAFGFLADGGFLNVFAGFPNRTESEIPVNLYDMHYRNWTLLATSGSPIEALQAALAACQAGRIDPNNVVAAVGGLCSALEGIDHLGEATFPGRIVIYPHLDLPLTLVEEVTRGAPWSTEAERSLFGRLLAEGRLSRP